MLDRFISLLAYVWAPLARYMASFSGWGGKKGGCDREIDGVR